MREASPTRAALLELQEEKRALHEGHVFLDEKCLLLAGEMLRQLQQHAVLERRLQQAHEAAMAALHAALARHGLEGLQVQTPLEPLAPPAAPGTPLATRSSSLMGVRLLEAAWTADPAPAEPPGIDRSPELRACRRAFVALTAAAAPLAAVCGNLERLSQEYRRSVRRARALQDVMLPELERDVADIETRLEELEQQDALAMRRRAA